MQIVIDITEEEYESIKKHPNWHSLGELIAHGTPLPKYHGDLIDRNDLFDSLAKDNKEAYSKHQVWLHCSNYNKDVPTIISESHSRVEIRMATGK